jgi:superfamily I DNA and/or RNA helicase
LFKQLREREKIDGIKRTVTLDKQYRMHPVLGQFVSDVFYREHGEAFTSGRDSSEFLHGLKRYGGAVAAWAEIPFAKGREYGKHSKRRGVEARWIAEEAKRIMNERPDFSVGVISFYSAQVDEILMQMEKVGLAEVMEDGTLRIADTWRETRDQSGKLKERLRVGTVDAFQGKEFDIVFLSMTRSNDLSSTDQTLARKKFGHLMLENRLCVAMSRQQRLLVVVGDPEMLRGPTAEETMPGLVQFYKVCGGPHGTKFLA